MVFEDKTKMPCHQLHNKAVNGSVVYWDKCFYYVTVHNPPWTAITQSLSDCF